MDINRRTAYETLVYIQDNKGYSNLTINKFINKNKPDNRAFVRELVYGVLENQIFIDNILKQFVHKGFNKLGSSVHTILRMGIYQLRFMNSVPDYAAVNESVVLSKKYCHGKDRFVNGVLRSYIKSSEKDFIPDKKDLDFYSIKYSCMPWIIKLWKKQMTKEALENLLEASNEKPEMTLRTNTLIISREELIHKLQSLGYQCCETSISKLGINVTGSGILDEPLFKEGFYGVQDQASMLAAEILSPQAGNLVIDVCAAPGGKTAAMGQLMDNKGEIIAMDLYEHKLSLILEEGRRLKLKNIKTKCRNSCKIDRELVGKADRVLVDVPCSGLGVIRRKPEIKLKEYPELAKLYSIQKDILDSSAEYLKKGGSLVYSTCTINDYENRLRVEEFLKTHGTFRLEYMKQFIPHIDGTD